MPPNIELKLTEPRVARFCSLTLERYAAQQQHTDFRPLTQVDDAFWQGLNELDKRLVGGRTSVAMPASLEVRNLVISRTSWSMGALSEFRDLLTRLDNLISLIHDTSRKSRLPQPRNH